MGSKPSGSADGAGRAATLATMAVRMVAKDFILDGGWLENGSLLTVVFC